MGTVRKLSLAMGLMSVVTCLIAAGLYWFLVQTSTHGLPLAPSLPPTDALNTQSCEALQQIVEVLTRQAKAKFELNNLHFQSYERLFNLVLLGALGWSALTSAGFLFIFRTTGRKD